MERPYTLREAAEIARVTPRTIKRWLQKSGHGMPVGRHPLIPPKLLERLISDSVPRLAR
jgi:hypothetical protein